MKSRAVFLLAVLFALGAGGAGCAAPRAGAPERPAERLEFAHTIPDAATWTRLAARPDSATSARTEVVKFLVDRAERRKVWFVDSERWPFHHDFARARLSTLRRPVADLEVFNAVEYRRPDRRFELGSLVHYRDSDLWTMELVSGDTLGGDEIAALLAQLRGALWVGERLRFRPLSELHERAIAKLREPLPVTTTAQVFAGVKYQPLTLGRAFGSLRIVRGPLDPVSVRPDQILVLEKLPEEIPVSAAVISAELQAPLGHIAILCATRGTPNFALRGALEHAALQRLDGKLVELTVGPQEFSVRAATTADAEQFWRAVRPGKPQVPRLDLAHSALTELSALRLADSDFAGAKAAQLGEAGRIPGVRTPGGFVVPVSHYRGHVDRSGANAQLAALAADTAATTDAAVRAARLAEVRAAIETAEVDPALLAEVCRRIRETAPAAKWILRSSTNAEDLAGFTGAGLYRSIVIKAGAAPEAVAKALREVWASVWLAGAYDERAWYRVEHGAVGMAVLVQPFVDGAVANGVAITANPFSEARPGLLVNAQALGGSVTGAKGDEVPEQILIYTFSEELEWEILSRSSRTGGAPLLGDAPIKELAAVLLKLDEHFRARWRGPANAVDVEFLIAGEDRHVVIVQARPFTVKYEGGRRLPDEP